MFFALLTDHFFQELISEIKRAVPDSKFENLKKILSDNVDLTWLIDQAQESQKDHEKPNTVHGSQTRTISAYFSLPRVTSKIRVS